MLRSYIYLFFGCFAGFLGCYRLVWGCCSCFRAVYDGLTVGHHRTEKCVGLGFSV